MKKSLENLPVLLLGCAAVCSAMKIESANENVTLTYVEENSNVIYYTANMNENNHEFVAGSQTPLFTISEVVANPDSEFYILESAFTKVLVKTEEGVFVLYSRQSFDYEDETQRRYSLTFLDQSSTIINVIFTINNIDDEPPTLTAPQCNMDENTVYTVDTSPCSCTVEDPDGWLASMTFNIIGDSETFAMGYREEPADTVYSAEVYIYTKVELKYPNSTFHIFDINAFDSAGHNTTPNALVRALIYVNDLRDTPPRWTSYISYEQFEEKQDQTFTVQARDGDTGIDAQVFYKKVREDEEDENYITIGETSGVINVRGIDRDRNDISFYNFELLAYVDENYSTPLNISFYIIDIDDNPPRIEYIVLNETDQVDFDDDSEKSFEISFLENFAGSFNTSIFIHDKDTGENAQFNVALEMYEGSDIDYTVAFLIVPTSGYRTANFEISVKNATWLDYENEDWQSFNFYVVSTDKLEPTLTDRLLVSVNLIDYNDEIPQFNSSEFEIYILETAEKDTLITQIEATDRDAEDQGRLNYRLEGSTYAKRTLRIESPWGEIYVNEEDAFDYDKVNPIFVQVVVNDLVNHTSSVTLTINLIDVNNKAPTISIDDMVNVEENQVIGIKLNVSITATDPDTDANLTAAIDWENSVARKNSRPLNMTDEDIRQQVEFVDLIFTKAQDSNDIDIELVVNAKNPTNTTPDFELFDALYLSIVVTDWNTDPAFLDKQNTTAVVLISVIDINDNIPYFPEAELDDEDKPNRTVQDDAKEGISVGSITAIDLDVGDIITYYCDPSHPDYDWLLLDNSTGALTVRDNHLIDADTGPTYYFYYNCTAVDTNPEHVSDVLVVPFYIIDVNNKEPVITINDTVYVVEKSPTGEYVSDIETSDADRDVPFHTVLCVFKVNQICGQVFQIENNVIKVLTGDEDLDRDTGLPSYDCTITCTDNPNQEQGDLTRHVKEASFTIKLIDINDHTPELDMETDVEVYENIKKGEEVVEILATDIDEGMNAEIDFELVQVLSEDGENVTDLFVVDTNEEDYNVSVTHKRSHLMAMEDLKGHFGSYMVFIRLTDKGEEPNTAVYNLSLVVNKFNFEQPRFVVPSDGDRYTLLSEQEPATQLIQFRENKKLPDFSASDNSDSDSCVRWPNMEFEVDQISPGGSSIFRVGETDTACSFQLQVNNQYDEVTVLKNKIYELMLIATAKEGTEMEGEAPYTGNVSITIVFQNETQEPIFDQTTWGFSFLEEDPSLTEPLPYPAHYQYEENDQYGPFYFLNADNYTAQFFAIDVDNGTVYLIQKLDYETDEEFQFEIVASNNRYGFNENRDPSSALQVTVTVIDINDNPPMWTSEAFYGAIMPTYTKGYPVVLVDATDADKIDQGKLKYNIASDFERHGDGISAQTIPEPFTIEENTGQVLLNFAVDSTMNGYFVFEVDVNDPPDIYSGATHCNSTSVTIFIVTSDNVVEFKFQNTREEVLEKEDEMLEIVSDRVTYLGFRKDLEYKVEDTGSYTYANLFFVNTSNTQVVEKESILKIVSGIAIFLDLKNTLLNETGLILVSFPSTNSNTENLEGVLRAWLIGVSVVLGALCLVLLITYILKIRQLKKRIKNLVDKTFGSQESGLNRLGVSLPTANKHTIEGSNPIYTIDKLEKERDLFDYQQEHDRESVKSGDSDLIGVEENPEFDYNFNQDDKKISTYM